MPCKAIEVTVAKQLRLVTDEERADARASIAAGAGPVERLFAHWVFMMGKRPRATMLGPSRRRALVQALGWGYDEAVLELAIEGCAATPHNMGENDRGQEYNDLTLILRDEAHIERFAGTGERLRAAAEREAEDQRRLARVHPGEALSDDEVRAQRDRLRAMARRLSGAA